MGEVIIHPANLLAPAIKPFGDIVAAVALLARLSATPDPLFVSVAPGALLTDS
jgi:hypothetical protein